MRHWKRTKRNLRRRYEELENRRVLATAVDDAYVVAADTQLSVPDGSQDLLANDSATTVNLAAGRPYSYTRLPMFSGGTFYFDEAHAQATGTFDTGDLTDGVNFTASAPTAPNPSTIVGWGDPIDLDTEIIFDLGATGLVTDVSIGTHTFAAFANGAPDDVVISFSNDGTNFTGAETFTFTAANVPGDGHWDLPADVTDTSAQYVRLSFDGGAVLTGNTPNKWMLDEIRINNSVGTVSVTSADTTSAQGATVAVNADGSFTYDPTSTAAFDSLIEGQIATDTFNYTITDGTDTDTGQVTVSVIGTGSPPQAVDDTLTTDEATPVASAGLPQPVALWTFDETTGTTAADVIGGNDATISGGVELGDPGATEFTGTSFDFEVGQVEAPYNATINPDGAFTVEAWAKVEGGEGGYRAVISARDGSVDADRQGFIIYAANDNSWQFWTGAGTNAWDVVNGPAIELNQWTHLVATFEPSGGPNAGGTYAGVATLYVNGQQVGQETNQRYEPNGLSRANPLTTRIGYGQNETVGGNFFNNGDLDNIAIYDLALTPEQIAARTTDRDGILLNDSDVDGSVFTVTAVNGNTADVGNSMTLPSGATVTVSETGDANYDPNGAFESVSLGSTDIDTFTYTITEQPSLTSGVVAQYRLDGDATDSSGNGHDGMIMEAVADTGQVGGALDFDGVNDKVDIPFDPAFNPDGDFTVSLWAKVEGGAGNFRSPITSRDDPPPGGDTQGFIIYASDANNWQFWTGRGAGGWDTITGPAVVENQWVHIVATFETTTGQNASGAFSGVKTLYIDGVDVGSATQLYEPNPKQVLRIGGGATETSGNFFFNGDVDEVAIWDRALDPTEIGNVYSLGLQGGALADVAGATDTATVTVTINGLNDPPTAAPATGTTNEDVSPYSFDLAGAASDPDADDTLTFSATQNVGVSTRDLSGAFTINGSELSFDTNLFNDLSVGESETLVFDYTVDDGAGQPDSTDSATLTITVEGRNDQPSAGAITDTTNEDAGVFSIGLAAAVSDSDTNDTLTITGVAQDLSGSDRDLGGAFTLSGSDLSFDTNLFNDLAVGETETLVFTYTVDDGTGQANSTATGTVTITIEGRNDAPSVVVDGPFTVDEGGNVTFTATATDPDSSDALSLSWDLDGDTVLGDSAAVSPTATYDDGPDSITVTVQVSDGTTTANATTMVTVNNVDPSLVIAAVPDALVNTPVAFTFTSTDPSTADSGASFVYDIDWGDGTQMVTGSANEVVDHTFATAGTYLVTVNSTDKDSGTSSDATFTIEIEEPNEPVVQVGDDIIVTGTEGSDRIVFTSTGAGFRVRFNDVFYPAFGVFSVNAGTQLIVNANEGSDTVIVHGTIGAPAVFDGGDGNDYLASGTDNDTLIGGAGNDVLLAGEGNNLIDGGADNDRAEGRDGIDYIFGGTGNDRLNGGGGNDILDGGADNDLIFGGRGDDLIAGREGVDSINGYAGNDVIYGGLDVDQLFGGIGNDLIFGGAGTDRLRGDAGDDVLVGGTSALEADTETSLDDLLAGGSLMSNVQTALDAWFASQDVSSRGLYQPFGDDNAVDELTGGTGLNTFQSGSNDRLRDVRNGDIVL